MLMESSYIRRYIGDDWRKKSPDIPSSCFAPKWLIQLDYLFWRRDPESNRAGRICNPLHNRFAIAPLSNEANLRLT